MNKRDTKFISRIIVLTMTALVLGLGARVVLENAELTKILPRSGLRDLLLVIAPLASLMAIQYTLAVKSFGMRSLYTEGMVFFFCASVFLAITLAHFFGQTVELPPEECPWWRVLGCASTAQTQANYIWSPLIISCGFVALFLALQRENILSRG